LSLKATHDVEGSYDTCLTALFLFFLPMSGARYFGLRQGPMFMVYLLLVNLPFGIVTALVARAIIGERP
jgi:hypothetical protein